MRKHVHSALALLLIVGMATATMMVSAQEPAQDQSTLNDWFTSVTFQNITTTTNNANVTIEAYAGEGSSAPVVTPESAVTIAPGGNVVFLPGLTDREGFINMTLPGGFIGGLYATSNEPIVAVSQVGNNQVGSVGNPGGAAIGQYRGSSATDTSISYPAVKNGLGNKVTVFSIQAAEGDITYEATITGNDGTTYTKTGNVSQNRTALLFPRTFSSASNTIMPPDTDTTNNCGFDANNANWLDTSPCLGSLTVRRTGGTGTLVGAVIETRSDVAIQNVGQAATMFTSGAGANTIYCPVVKHESGSNQNTSGVTVQNLGDDQVTVQMQTVLSGGGTGSASLDIPAGASRTFFASTLGFTAGTTQFGAATINVTSGTGPIIAAVNESNVTVATLPNQKQVTYTCFSASEASNQLAFPLVKEVFGSPAAATSINLQNIGTSNASVNVSYVCDTGTVTFEGISIAGGAGNTLFVTSGSPVGGVSVPSNSNCAVTASATAGTQLIGFAQDTSDLGFIGGSNSTLDLRNYESFPVSSQ